MVTFKSKGGNLTATRKSSGQIELNFPLRKTSNSSVSKNHYENLLKIDIKNIAESDSLLILELPNEDAVKHFIPDFMLIKDKINYDDLVITSQSNGKNDFISRVFCPRDGINEDHVTGSAHCALADYWRNKCNKNTFLVYQASERGGELELEIKGNRVLIRGVASTVLSGTLLL